VGTKGRHLLRVRMRSMSPGTLALLSAAVLVVAFLYSSVGHAGASGYIAVMALAGLSPDFIKPTALILNILVACLSSWQFYRAGYFSWRLFWPLAVVSVPCAFLGGWLRLPTHLFNILLGLVLLYSAVRFLLPTSPEREPVLPALPTCLGVGAGLGFVSGLTGVGGGIFLTPLLIIRNWARTRTASAVSAVFILVNSSAGLAGAAINGHTVSFPSFPLAAAVLVGGAAGSYLGSHRFTVPLIKKLLSCVLTIAAMKLLFS
jgi:uncharacterized membrane protein YfcA